MTIRLPYRLKCIIEDAESEEGQQRLIDTHWQLIASIAWAGYLDLGRGVVWIDLNNGEPGLTGAGLGMKMQYCGLDALVESGLMRKPEIADIVKSYDVNREVLTALQCKDGSLLMSRRSSYGGLPDPPEACCIQLGISPSVDPRLN